MKQGDTKFVVTVTRVTSFMQERKLWKCVATDAGGAGKYDYVLDQWWAEQEDTPYRQEFEDVDLAGLAVFLNDTPAVP